MEAITTAFVDEFPQLRANLKHKSLFLALLCFVFYLMGLLLITDVSVKSVKLGSQMAERLGNRDSNQKVAGSI